MNPTMRKFGYPGSLVADYEYWAVRLRPQQVTLGALVLACKENVTSFGAVSPAAGAELVQVVARGRIGQQRVQQVPDVVQQRRGHQRGRGTGPLRQQRALQRVLLLADHLQAVARRAFGAVEADDAGDGERHRGS